MGCRQRHGQVRQRQARHQGAGRSLSQPHARGDDLDDRHQVGGGHEGPPRLDRLDGQRHGGVRQPRAGSGRPRSRQGHPQGAARRRRERQRGQGQQDRGVLLGRRPADGGRHRSRGHAQHQDRADRLCRPDGEDERQVRPALFRDVDPARRPTRAWTPTTRTSRCGTSSRSTARPRTTQAYEITKVLFDKQADLALVHAEGRNFSLKVQSKANAGIPVPSRRAEVPRPRRA